MEYVRQIGITFLILLLWVSDQVAAEQYALLVGVKQYDPTELTSLKYTEKDVVAIAETLRSKGYKKDNVVLMTQSSENILLRPTAKRIRKQIELLLSNRKPEDTVLFAFTGHGVQFKGQGQHYFCPSDAEINDKETLISLAKVFDALEECRAAGKVLLVDACRDDPLSGLAKSSKRIELETISNDLAGQAKGGTVAFFSCAKSQHSWEDPKLEHGVFFYHVNRALSGEADFLKDGSITFNELTSFVTPETTSYARINLGAHQHPTFRSLGDSQDIILIAGSGPKKTVFNEIGMKLKLIPAGEFMMGSAPTEHGRSKYEDLHSVEISKPFYIGATEVTQRQWAAVMKSKPWVVRGKDKDKLFRLHPENAANYISWHEATEFCQRLGESENRIYRLPTEAEWEYACRANDKVMKAFSFGDSELELGEHGWFFNPEKEDYRNKFAEHVAKKRPNKLGLYDMHGNVYEWCSDWMDRRYYRNRKLPKKDPKGPAEGVSRVLRGGSFGMIAGLCRSACRFESSPDNHWPEFGFRVVMEVEPPKKK